MFCQPQKSISCGFLFLSFKNATIYCVLIVANNILILKTYSIYNLQTEQPSDIYGSMARKNTCKTIHRWFPIIAIIYFFISSCPKIRYNIHVKICCYKYAICLILRMVNTIIAQMSWYRFHLHYSLICTICKSCFNQQRMLWVPFSLIIFPYNIRFASTSMRLR